MTSVGQSILMLSLAVGRGFRPGRTEQKRCLGFAEREGNGTRLMLIKAVSIADERERVVARA